MFRNRLFLFSLVFFIFAASAAVFPTLLVLKTREDFQAVRVSVADLESRAHRAGALQARWETVKKEGERINGAILDRKNLPTFFSAVEATAAAAGVTESNALLSETNGEMRFRLSAEGPFPNLFVFITHLNVLPTLLFVEEVNLHSGSGKLRAGAGALSKTGEPTADVVVRVPLSGEIVASKAPSKKPSGEE